jgi:serine protease Do
LKRKKGRKKMYKNTAMKFSSGCFLLVRKKGNSVFFLGTAFLIHEEGYLLTAAHLLENNKDNLMVVKPLEPDGFTQVSFDTVSAIEVEAIEIDSVHNAALLKFRTKFNIETPDHLAGSAESTIIGTSLLCFGFPFGHQDLHNLTAQGTMLSSKILSKDGTNLLLFDSVVHEGMSGGPIVNLDDGRVIGIIIGRFSPIENGGDFVKIDEHPDYQTGFSYAISIEYGTKLLQNTGLEVI